MLNINPLLKHKKNHKIFQSVEKTIFECSNDKELSSS